MDLSSIATIISNLGFPITCVIVMFYFLQKEQNSHKEETQKLTEAINNNTIVMERVLERLDEKKNKGVKENE